MPRPPETNGAGPMDADSKREAVQSVMVRPSGSYHTAADEWIRPTSADARAAISATGLAGT